MKTSSAEGGAGGGAAAGTWVPRAARAAAPSRSGVRAPPCPSPCHHPPVPLHEAQLKRFDKLYEENKIDTATYLGLVSNLKVVA